MISFKKFLIEDQEKVWKLIKALNSGRSFQRNVITNKGLPLKLIIRKGKFDEERFEETITLVDEGYKRLSEIEASQTTVRLFYSTTTKTLKTFFIENWKKLTIFINEFYSSFFIFNQSKHKHELYRRKKTKRI